MRILAAALSIAFLVTGAPGGEKKGPEIRVIDNKYSIHAEAVPLSRLLGLLDRATGMTSTVPAELANRNVSVQFSGLSLDQAIKKVFEGLPVDYVVVQNQGIFVTAPSQSASSAPSTPGVAASNPAFPAPDQGFIDQPPMPFTPEMVPVAPDPQAPMNAPQVFGFPGMSQGEQPAMIQTPFGPIPNPRANTNPLQPNNMPQALPGQSPYPMYPGVPPLGANNPFTNSNQFGNNPLGNTAPPLFNTNPTPFPGSPAQPPKKP